MITPNEPHQKLAKILGIKSLFLKREDLHPAGSHKGRSISVMIDHYIDNGLKHFAISSSGNAALAAAYHINKINKDKKDKINLNVLVGQHIPSNKLKKIEIFKDDNIKVTMHDRPLQTLFNITKDPNIKSLRQSTDDISLKGYEDLAKELIKIPDLQAIFIGTSSGTTAQALAQYFNENHKEVEIHIVQTSSCHPIADSFNNNDIHEEDSIADAIVDQSAIRKELLSSLIRKNNGMGWIASNEQIKDAQIFTKNNTRLSISTNSALSIAGLMQAIYTGKTWTGSVVCMICGD